MLLEQQLAKTESGTEVTVRTTDGGVVYRGNLANVDWLDNNEIRITLQGVSCAVSQLGVFGPKTAQTREDVHPATYTTVPICNKDVLPGKTSCCLRQGHTGPHCSDIYYWGLQQPHAGK